MGTYQWKPFTLLVSADEVKGNEMKIEAGKYYKTRDGRKVGPTEVTYYSEVYPKAKFWVEGYGLVQENGKFGNDEDSPSLDLISEWKDEAPSPIRNVTRREIVAGVYGRLHVSRDFSMGDKSLRIALSDSQGDADPAGHYWNLDELDEVIHTLSQIREVIAEENVK